MTSDVKFSIPSATSSELMTNPSMAFFNLFVSSTNPSTFSIIFLSVPSSILTIAKNRETNLLHPFARKSIVDNISSNSLTPDLFILLVKFI